MAQEITLLDRKPAQPVLLLQPEGAAKAIVQVRSQVQASGLPVMPVRTLDEANKILAKVTPLAAIFDCASSFADGLNFIELLRKMSPTTHILIITHGKVAPELLGALGLDGVYQLPRMS